MSHFNRRFILAIVAVFTVLAYQNCGSTNDRSGQQNSSVTLEGTGTGNPGKATVDLSFRPYRGLLDPSGMLINLQNLSMCLRSIQLEGPSGDQNFDFDLNDLAISPDGTYVTGIIIPLGTYQEITYRLRGENCDSGQSISFTNSNGSFSEVDEIELEFEGEIIVTAQNSHSVQFLIDQIAVSLNQISQDNQIKPVLESLLEGFEHESEDDDD